MKSFHILKSNKFVYFFLIILVGLFFSINQINIEDFWYDEIATFWVSDPDLSFKETNSRLLSSENTPLLYYMLVKYFFKIFSYNPELLRLINIPIFLTSLIYFNLILKKISENGTFFLFASLLFVSNSFLISYVHEGRTFMLFCLVSLIFINEYMSINQSIKNYHNIKLKYLFLFILSFLLLNTFIFSFLILCSIFFYEILFNRNKNSYIFILIIFFSVLLFILLNYQFLLNLLNFKSTIQQLDKDFYYNFYFSQFFGSKIMGLLFLFFFIWGTFKFLKSAKINKNIILIYLIILFSYLVPIIYGFFFTPVLQDRYVIYLVPLIILIISYSITHHYRNRISNILLSFLILLSLSNQLLKNYKSEINKPMFKAAVEKVLEVNSSKLIFTSYNDNKSTFVNMQLQNYISNLPLITINNFSIIDKTPNSDFFLICYDPTNTYNMCLKNNTLNFIDHHVIDKKKYYQVILFHYNMN